MNRIVRPLILIAALALAGAGSLLAQPVDEVEAFRADLLLYVSELQRLPDPLLAEFQASGQSLADARSAVEAMSRADLEAIQVQMDRLPFWRGVPGMLTRALAQATGGPSPLDIAASAQDRINTNARFSRAMLRTMFIHFRSIPAEQVHPDYQAEVDRLEAMIDQATPEQIIQLDRELALHMDRWNQQLGAARSGTFIPGEGAVGGLNHCGDSFPNSIICGMTHLFNDIGTFFSNLPTYATNAFNSVINFFDNFVSNLPTTFSGIVNTLGLDDVNWNQIAQTALDYARLPCPPDEFLLPGFGPVGELETFTNFSGTIGFAGNVITDLTPSDVLTSVNLQAVMIVINFPIQWLSRCLENSWEDNWDSMQAEHRSLVAGKLDVQASTRVSQFSLDGGQAQVIDLDGDVVNVEAKLDRLGINLDRIELTTLRLDGKSDELEEKIENLQLQQGQTNDILDEFRLHMLRMLIEKNLFGHGNFKIGLFQTPQSLGGLLEMAASLVSETIQKRASAGVNVKNAAREYNNGVQQHAAGNFKSAYDHFRNAYSQAVN